VYISACDCLCRGRKLDCTSADGAEQCVKEVLLVCDDDDDDDDVSE